MAPDLERIEGISLELRLPVEVHVLEGERPGEPHRAGTSISNFLYTGHLRFLLLVGGALRQLMLLQHGYFIVCIRCIGQACLTLISGHRLPHASSTTARVLRQTKRV